MSQPVLKTRRQYVADAIRRIVAYTTALTYFGPNTPESAIAEAIGGGASGVARLYRAVLRRITLLASSGSYTTAVAAEMGAERLGPLRAGMFVVVQPHTTRITAITSSGTDLLEVSDSSEFAVDDSIRVRNSTGSVTETATIIAITTGTGPNSGDELEVATLAGSYTPSTTTDAVLALKRHTLPAETVVKTNVGVDFQTTAVLSVGDANPIMDGEGTHLGLADKVWCEAVEAGAAGNVDPLAVTAFSPAVSEVRGVLNPERAYGGALEEPDFDLKFRASHGPTVLNQETEAWIEARCREADADVLRAIRFESTSARTMGVVIFTRSGTALSATRLAAIKAWIEQRVRSNLLAEVVNGTFTSVEVYAQVGLEPNTSLRTVWKAAAERLVAQALDFRKRAFGQDVDEALLLSLVRQTPGVASLVTETFTPSADVAVGAYSLPRLTGLTLVDVATGDTLNPEFVVGF